MSPSSNETIEKIAIIGGGPAGLFLYKQLIESGNKNLSIEIFESKDSVGDGMPYSPLGANPEHITNVSGNEIPDLVTEVMEWIPTIPENALQKYNLHQGTLTDYKVLPRLLFGEYLRNQFALVVRKADELGVATRINTNTSVLDIEDQPTKKQVLITIEGGQKIGFDKVVICTGHNWPKKNEGIVPGYFDSPYPPSKLAKVFDHEIAVRGSSLTAIDAIRTLARQHGRFIYSGEKTTFQLDDDLNHFKIVMHSRNGLLPAIRFHLEDPHLSKSSLLSEEDILAHRNSNQGFLSLDYIFQKDFKDSFREKDPAFFELIKAMTIEEFVEAMMNMREKVEPFKFFKAEYAEAKKSIRQKKSVYWKEMLAILSFAMNYPAKHLSAEDMQRLQHVLMPLISIVIAFVPQSSCEEMLALHQAGRLELVSVGDDSRVEPDSQGGAVYFYTDDNGNAMHKSFRTFIDCIGQKHLSLDEFPFRTLVNDGTLDVAKLRFRSNEAAIKTKERVGEDVIEANNSFYLKVPGIAISDSFRVLEKNGETNPRIYLMAVAYIGGYNPDYSGLDFCEEASKLIVKDMYPGNNA